MCCTAGIYWAKELKSSSSLVRRNNHTAVLVSQVLGIINNKRSHLTTKTSFVFLKFFHKSLEFSSFGLKYLTCCKTKPNKHRQHNKESGPRKRMESDVPWGIKTQTKAAAAKLFSTLSISYWCQWYLQSQMFCCVALEFSTRCHSCSQKLRGAQCWSCKAMGLQCVICHVAVRGKNHLESGRSTEPPSPPSPPPRTAASPPYLLVSWLNYRVQNCQGEFRISEIYTWLLCWEE